MTAGHWDFPTRSNSITTAKANFDSVGRTTDAGSYPYASPYGTYDQGGNVFEWNESVIKGLNRGVRGGSLIHGYMETLNATYLDYAPPTYV